MLMNKAGNKVGDATVEALSFVQGSAGQFYLTGSRFFGNNAENSDYDFFTEATDEVAVELAEAGFKLLSEGNYEGTSAVVAVWEKGKVQVQLVLDAPLKERIQSGIKHHIPGFGHLDKNQRKLVWRLCYNLLTDFGVSGADKLVVHIEPRKVAQKVYDDIPF